LNDIPAAGRIIHRAFAAAFRRHGYIEPITSAESGEALAAAVYTADPAGSIGLESPRGRLAAVSFAQISPTVATIGPLAVDPGSQGLGLSTRLLHETLALASTPSIRLLQDSFNPVSFRLYAHAGFEVRETLALAATAPGGPEPGAIPRPEDGESADSGIWSLRDIAPSEAPMLAELDRSVGGVDRTELFLRLAPRMRSVVLDGPKRPRGFACGFLGRGVWVLGPAWAEDGRTLAAIVVGLAQRCVRDHESVATFIPTSRAELLRPLFECGFRVSHLLNLMVKGDYEPWRGAMLPVLPVDVGEVK